MTAGQVECRDKRPQTRFAAYRICRGKHSPSYHPAMDMGAYVIVINADQVELSGAKETQKTYFNHVNGRPGSYRVEPFLELRNVSQKTHTETHTHTHTHTQACTGAPSQS